MKENLTAQTLYYRELVDADRPYLEDIIRKTWHYDAYCSPETARKMAAVFLASCLANQTFTCVAVLSGKPVGVIMGHDRRIRCVPFARRLHQLKTVLSLLRGKEGRRTANMFSGIDQVDCQLRDESGKNYPGELSLFVVGEECRGKGVGKQLFDRLLSYMKQQDISSFYLFTDTTCNYGFYEHRGMRRKGEIVRTVPPSSGRDIHFFLYEYNMPRPNERAEAAAVS